jgi:hypothetical protein
MGYYTKPLVLQFALLVANFGMRDISKITALLRRNLELGLRICCGGLILHMSVIAVGGGDIFLHVSPVRRFFLSVIEIFSVLIID